MNVENSKRFRIIVSRNKIKQQVKNLKTRGDLLFFLLYQKRIIESNKQLNKIIPITNLPIQHLKILQSFL